MCGANFILYIGIICLCLVNLNLAQDRCRTPNQTVGECVSLYDCPSLLTIFSKRPIPSSSIDYLRRSHCGFDGRLPRVCCRSSDGEEETTTRRVPDPVTRPTERPSRTRATTSRSTSDGGGEGNVLPKPPNCGGAGAGNRIYGGLVTEIDEFPWMALLQYRRANGSLDFACGGVLINKYYVLTAAHCLTGEINDRIGELAFVRLGEYDTDSETDCNSSNDCADPVQDIPVAETTVHEEYDPRAKDRYHDIGLVRLARPARYSEFVSPICLPLSVPNFRSSAGDSVSVAGWGRTLTSRQSSVKLKLELPLVDETSCRITYRRSRINLGDGQICAGGEYALDACDGDSGGPLMQLIGVSWTSIGVVSFGRGCGVEGWPGVYTNVAYYMFWIEENLKP